MSKAPPFLDPKYQAQVPQSKTGTIVKWNTQSVTIDTDTEKLTLPMALLKMNGKAVQAKDLKMQMQCVQEGGVWKVQPSESSPVKRPCLGLNAGPSIPPPMPNIKQPIQGMEAMSQAGHMKPMPVVPSKRGIASPNPVVISSQDGMHPASVAPLKGVIPGPKPSVGVPYQVMKLENQQVTIKIENIAKTIPFSCFNDVTQLKIGCSVRTDDGNRWTVVALIMPPRPVPSQPQVQPAQPKELKQQGSGVFKIVKVQGNGVMAQEDNFPQAEVPLERIFSKDGQSVTARQLKVHMNMQMYPNGTFSLLCDIPPDQNSVQQPIAPAVVPAAPPCCLPIAALNSVYPGLETASFQALQDYAANKYAEMYVSRKGSHVRSVSCCLVQFALFESTCYQQEAGQAAMPITQAFGLQGLNGGMSLKDPEFEETYARAIEIVEERVKTIITSQYNLDYSQVAAQLQVCLTVLLHNTSESFDRRMFFPPNCPLESKWQHLVLIGQPPFPVLIQKKLQPLLAENAQTTGIKFKFYIYKSLKVKPPEIDPNLMLLLKQVGATDGELTPLASSFVRFSSDMLARFTELVNQQSVGQYPCSEVGMALQSLSQHAQKLGEICRDHQMSQEVAGLAQNVEGIGYLFTHPCTCGGSFVDVVLGCGHGLCKRELEDMVLRMRQRGGKMINKADGTTMMVCPVDGSPVTVASLQEFSNSLVEELEKEGNAGNGLAPCASCKKARSTKILVTMSCGHQICGSCFNPMCPICNTRQDNLSMSLNGWTLQCDACQNQFSWTMINPGNCERGHVLCPSCCFAAVKTQRCRVYGCAEVTSEEITLMKTKAVGTCQACRASKKMSSLTELPCACVICEICSISKTKETFNYLSCWCCSTPFSQALSQSLYDKAGLSAALLCAFCGGLLTDGGRKLACGDSTHPQCLYNHAYNCIHSNPPTRVLCQCEVEVHADDFMEMFDSRTSQQLANFFLKNPWYYEVRCPRCGPDSEILQISRKLNKPESARCSRCDYIYCVLCLDSATDQFHQVGTCKYVVARSQIKELEMEKKKAVQCPHCLMVQEKGQGWQQCQICQCHFCAECVMEYYVINSHGYCYHREDCPQYIQHNLISGEFCHECPTCQVTGGNGACPKPSTLARQGQFAPWEKPKAAGEVQIHAPVA